MDVANVSAMDGDSVTIAALAGVNICLKVDEKLIIKLIKKHNVTNMLCSYT